MLKIIPLKKQLTAALIKKKLFEYPYFFIVHSLKVYSTVKNIFTKNALINNLLSNFFKKNTVHFPLILHFFFNKKEFLNFIEKYFNQVLIIKVQNTLLKFYCVSLYIFSFSFIIRMQHFGIF